MPKVNGCELVGAAVGVGVAQADRTRAAVSTTLIINHNFLDLINILLQVN
jgi:hypothetical protein